MKCWFDQGAEQTRLQMTGLVARIGVRHPEDLSQALAQIEDAQKRGHWVALVAHYELGAWLDPALKGIVWPDQVNKSPELLTAWVFKHAEQRPLEAADEAWSSKAQITSVKAGLTWTRYQQMIESVRALIAAGEVYQINATFPLMVQVQGQARALYEQILQQSAAAHATYIHDEEGGRHILSWSPELFVARTGSNLITRPMKGTAPRVTEDVVADAAMGQALLDSPKDRAENLMIVDLLRNDLGRLAQTGTVRVDPLFALEKYPTVWTMTSTIEAQLKPRVSLLEILQALFPCGSITGAPKIAAMKQIRRLEMGPRGVYCGSIGWLAPNGDFSLNVAIRTLVLNEAGQGTYHVGGGIVYDSDPAKEWQECFWKARVLGVPVQLADE